jgi:uncharacterized protein (TIGR03083 family)
MDTWEMIAAERRELADFLDTLTDDEWKTPSLCGAWTVHELLGHLTMPFHLPLSTAVVAMARNRFDFNKVSEKISRERAATIAPGDLVADLRANAEHRFTPPLAGNRAPLTDVIVHGQDMRRPLDKPRAIPDDRARTVLEFLTTGRNLGFVPRGRLRNLRFNATNLDWSFGEGQNVSGPAEALMLAITGRPVAFDDLEGEGVATLRSRV